MQVQMNMIERRIEGVEEKNLNSPFYCMKCKLYSIDANLFFPQLMSGYSEIF